jgi:redox-sensitive bicupin YhaK (pirin superfamily)
MTTVDETAVRSVLKRVESVRTIEGGGFAVRRPFPTEHLAMYDPFLLLDEMGPSDYGPGEAVGAPDHPHRGFETVTYMLDGSFQHKDSAGNSGILKPGSVQWMTAGAGVVHSEMPSDELMENGGRLHGFQLWVNLPAAEKMVPPCYQEYQAEGVPVASNEHGVWVRAIAGDALGVDAVIDTHTPIMYLHFILQPGASHVQRVPSEYNAFAYIVEGVDRFGRNPDAGEDEDAVEGDLVAFDQDGGRVRVTNTGDDPLSFLLLGGLPLNEPVARYGPFVMNTQEEIVEAVQDYQAGRMGAIDF